MKEDAEATYWTERAKLLARYEKAMKATVLPWINKISARINFFQNLLPFSKIYIIVNGEPANKILVAKQHFEKNTKFDKFFDNLFLDDEIVQKAIDVRRTYNNKKNDDMVKQYAHKQMKAIEQNLKKVMAFEEKVKKIATIEENIMYIKEVLDKMVLKDSVNA
jgi:hypothetical protein